MKRARGRILFDSEDDDSSDGSGAPSRHRQPAPKRRRSWKDDDFNPSKIDSSSSDSSESTAGDLSDADSSHNEPTGNASDAFDDFDGNESDLNESHENGRQANEPRENPNDSNLTDDFEVPERDQNQNHANKRPRLEYPKREDVIKNISRDHLEVLANHIFLPRRIREGLAREEPLRDIERVLDLLVETMRNFGTKLELHLPKIFTAMSELYKRAYENKAISPMKILNHLIGLMPGRMFAFYLHHQNCGFIAYRPQQGCHSEQRIISTFQGSLPNETITDNKGDVQASQLTLF